MVSLRAGPLHGSAPCQIVPPTRRGEEVRLPASRRRAIVLGGRHTGDERRLRGPLPPAPAIGEALSRAATMLDEAIDGTAVLRMRLKNRQAPHL